MSCADEFNMDSLRCVSTPSVEKVYNENMKCYMVREFNKQTDPSADDYTTKYPLRDSVSANCKQTHPFWDGLACVDCLDPFSIFDIESKKCGVC